MIKKFYTIFQTEAGWTGVAGSSSGIYRTSLPQTSREKALEVLSLTEDFQLAPPGYFNDFVRSLTDYYLGLPVEFSVLLDFSGLTKFQIAVYQAAMTIPYGETRSYGWIAQKIAKPLAARAVGHALGQNPLPIIVPCHRVLAADGGLGGFGGGLPLKQFLLNLESTK